MRALWSIAEFEEFSLLGGSISKATANQVAETTKEIPRHHVATAEVLESSPAPLFLLVKCLPVHDREHGGRISAIVSSSEHEGNKRARAEALEDVLGVGGAGPAAV
jgi:hypothetical protein